ncbi:alpha/beta fold hydrolase [Umezawaea tangerina]|uniref:alpha/beta fold hydrolase n=1 Tax=Umezawaea tangerina TaxID=84725 RepID=UPI00147564A1|nr:alpha/beta hydrolase [Umezawaea tangerina]
MTSRDGTRIGFTRSGNGPGLVLVQGAMADLHAYDALATALSSSFTVYAADRRGRGLSPKPFDSDHTIARDVEDVDAILAATGADRVFGLSSGAVITLEAARTLDRIARIALYEPPFYAAGISRGGIRRLNSEIERGDLASALLDSLLVAGTAPAPIRLLPRPLARLLAAAVMAVDQRRARPGSTFRDLLPGVRYDFHDVATVDGGMNAFTTVTMPVLLLSGTTSPAFLRDATLALRALLPDSRHVVIDGAGHDGPWNSGNPHAVAAALRTFFA